MSEGSLTIEPQAGPQTEFLSTSADIAIYGGAAGGGKSFACLMEALRNVNNKGFGATFFRRTYPQIKAQGGLWEEARNLYIQLGAKANVSNLEFTFPSGATIKFGHLQHSHTVEEYQGSQICLIIFDELTHFEESQFFYMMSRNRSTCGVRPYIRATCNPDANSWVKKFLAPWIDKRFKGTPAQSGEIRYMYRDGGEIIWVEPDERPPARAKTVTFIRSTIYDNKILMKEDPGYLANLESLPLIERQRLLHGNWDIKHEDRRYDVDWFKIWPRGREFETVAQVRYWDLAATEEAENRNACFTAGALVSKLSSGDYLVEDIRRVQFNPGDVDRLIQRTAKRDGKEVEIWIEQEPGASGKAVISDYSRKLAGYIFHGDRVTGDKATRSRPLEVQAEFGNIYLLDAKWNQTFLDEAENYPLGHKDQIDAVAGALDKVAEIGRFGFA